MKLTKRIFASNAWIVLCSLAALWGIGAGLFRLAQSGYFLEIGELSRVDTQTPAVRQLLAGWDGDWQQLDAALDPYRYGLLVYDDRGAVYSSVAGDSDRLLRIARHIHWPDREQPGVYALFGVTAVGGSTPDGATVLAVHASPAALALGERWGTNGPGRTLLAGGMLLLSLAALGGISLFFTQRLARSIAEPVDQLTRAARRVQAGNLAVPVRYRGLREFELVGDTFNQMQQHLLEQREQGARYEQARTELVAGISHDLRTPLTAVQGYVKGVLDGVAVTPEQQRRYLQVAYQSACEMDALLQQLFYFSRLETGSLPIFPTADDLGEFAADYADGIRPELALQGADIRVEGADRPHPVALDREQMGRVLANLVGNAARYAGADPLRLTVTVRSTADGREQLLFRDNGQGVPSRQLPRLFDQFYRGDAARTAPGAQGSGLGLYIARHIVEAHGGSITAENDGGLLLTITLPRRN